MSTAQVACPVEGCSFQADSEGSVYAHVTASQEPSHAGKRGQDYADEIQAGEPIPEIDPPPEGESEDSDTTQADDDTSGMGAIDYESRIDDSGSDEMPGLPITPAAAVVIVAAILVALYLVRSRGSESGATATQPEEESENEEFDADDVMDQRTERRGGLT